MKIYSGLLLLLTLVFFSVPLWANTNIDQNSLEESSTEENSSEENNSEEKNKQLQRMLNTLQIKQGIATFTQKKHLSFLANPIQSKGLLKIYQNSVIWQVQSPVFSKLVIIEDQVWQLTDKNSTNYQLLVSNASVETLIRAVFTGDISESQWHISMDEQQCLKLTPKDMILSQAINHIGVCVSDNQAQRFVTIKDAQNNVTEIELMITTEQLSGEDIREFDINP